MGPQMAFEVISKLKSLRHLQIELAISLLSGNSDAMVIQAAGEALSDE